jgi:hypothetical protein
MQLLGERRHADTNGDANESGRARSNMDTLWRGILRGRRKSTADGTLMMFKRFEE